VVLDVVVESIAIADAIKRQSGGKRDDFSQARMRRPEPILRIGR
jgi:hypothetical protein